MMEKNRVTARRGICASCAIAGLLIGCVGTAYAQEFSLFLQCTGELSPHEGSTEAYADFAFRFNGRTTLIQRSNILPVGERLAFVPTPTTYTMTYRLRPQGTQIVALPGWFQTSVLVRYPDLQRLNQIRISIDRNSGRLDGVILNEAEQNLASFGMQCRAISEAENKPKF